MITILGTAAWANLRSKTSRAVFGTHCAFTHPFILTGRIRIVKCFFTFYQNFTQPYTLIKIHFRHANFFYISATFAFLKWPGPYGMMRMSKKKK